MTDQLTLFCDTKRERFEKFHAENPQVYRELVRWARFFKRLGFRRFGIQGLFAVVRYGKDSPEINRMGDIFELNNDASPFYSRLIEKQESDLRGFLSTRAMKED